MRIHSTFVFAAALLSGAAWLAVRDESAPGPSLRRLEHAVQRDAPPLDAVDVTHRMRRRDATATIEHHSDATVATATPAEERAPEDFAVTELLGRSDRGLANGLLDLVSRGEAGIRSIDELAHASEELRAKMAVLRPRRPKECSAELLESLAAARASGADSVRVFALRATAVCDATGTEDAACIALADPSAQVRAESVDILLGRQLAPVTVAALRGACGDEDSHVRRGALDALAAAAQDAATEEQLVRALGDADAVVRRAAARGLGRFERCAPSALRALDAARFDRDGAVASAASRAVLDLSGR